uniref:PARP catalytic domain-containing protein n=1 Tax=Bionectria ochroleuca TaxID=29856 RepID=A0A8H7TQA4_BIOOC
MGYKQFVADLRAAKEADIDAGVTEIRPGESEGSVSFNYTHQKLVSPLEIHVLDQNIDEYPEGSSFILFTASDCAGDSIVSFLSGLTPKLTGKSVQEVIASIARDLTTFIENPDESQEHSDEFEVADHSSQSDAWDEDDDDEDYEDQDDDAFGLSAGLPPTRQEPEIIIPLWQDKTDRQRHDLALAIDAGISVAAVGDRSGQLGEIIAMSINISRLGLTDDIHSIWGLRSSDHIMLLLQFPAGYPSLADFLTLQSHQAVYRARLGKCASIKPSLSSARSALSASQYSHKTETNDMHQVLPGEIQPPDADHQVKDDKFTPLHLFNSITTLLNQEFPALLRTRREHGLSWDSAQELLLRRTEGAHVRDANYSGSDAQHIADALEKNQKQQQTPNLPPILAQDHALEDEATFSIPLSMMLFSLRRLIQSSKYCASCHQRVTDGFEGMKPYVCSRPLCMDQYFSSGMAPGIEHDIINSPVVVDLLISFFFSAVSTLKIREVPKGLGLLTLYSEDLISYHDDLHAIAYFADRRVQMKTGGTQLRVGERLFLMDASSETGPYATILSYPLSRCLCRVTALDLEGFNFEICAFWKGSSAMPEHPITHQSLSFPTTSPDDTRSRRDGVSEMREFLIAKPGRRLSSWEKLDHQTYKLLHWIIVSNQSLIIQDNPGPGQSTDGEAPSTRLMGMPENWMQFRFLQGSPEKELTFQQEMKSSFEEQLARREKPFPTIFGWHGSHVGNWHSIIRTTLDHIKIEHGRSFGNGVYLSKDLSTSASYSGLNVTMVTSPDLVHPLPFFTWPHSVLQVGSAVGCCEIINQTDQFVTAEPYYVVNNIDWIQCRYLFVHINVHTLAESGLPFLQQTSRGSLGKLRQDPARHLLGPQSKPIDVPRSAVPIERFRMFPYLAPRWILDGENKSEEWTVGSSKGVDVDGILG